MPRKTSKPASDKKPLFEKKDVVQLIGIPSPLMLVAGVGEEPEDEDDGFTVNVIFFNAKGEDTNDYGDTRQYSEELLQLVTPAAVVARRAAEATEAARRLP